MFIKNKIKSLSFASFLMLSFVGFALAQTPVRWKEQNPLCVDRVDISYASSGSAIKTRLGISPNNYGPYRAVSRQAVVAVGDKFTFKFPRLMGGNEGRVGLKAGNDEPSWQSNVSYGVNQSGDVFPNFTQNIPAGATITLEKTSATTIVYKSNDTILQTTTIPSNTPLYLSAMLETLNHSNTATVTEAMFTGTGLTGLPAAPSAPTITATAGHKRNHVNITNFGGGDGVSIYRSTIAGTFDYNAPLATEVRYPTFEDKNLTNGTTYYYVARSTKGGLSESVSSSQVSAAPQAGAIPAMSDKAAFIVGAPSVKPIGDANPLASPPTEYNYDEFQEFAVLRAAHILPKREPSAAISGTVSFTNGDKTITGSGTNFLADYRVDGNISVGGSYYQIRWIESNTVMHLWYPYNGATASGISHRPTGDYVNNSDSGRLEAYTNYYDTNMSAYALYFRTGNPYVLQLANEGAVMWRNHIEYESVTRHGGWSMSRIRALPVFTGWRCMR
jgi:hypothetical protein